MLQFIVVWNWVQRFPSSTSCNVFKFNPKTDSFPIRLFFQFKVGTFPYYFRVPWLFAFIATWIKVNMVTRIGKWYLFTFKSLKAREKTSSVSAMNLKSLDISLLYVPYFDLIRCKSIGVIRIRASHGVGHTYKGSMNKTIILHFKTLKR